MLSAIGESPLSTLTSVTATDVVMAINLARNTIREVNNMGWKYNLEFGYELVPWGTCAWTGTDASTATLNIFQVPPGMMRYFVSACGSQSGTRLLDLTVRPAGSFAFVSLVEGSAILKQPIFQPVTETHVTDNSLGGSGYAPPGYIFYDRTKNRPGLDSTLYKSLFIDPVWSTDFVNLPEDARRYIAVRASRQLAQQVVSSAELSQFSAQDELFALRDLKRSEGQEDDLNMFNNIESYEMLGNRTGMAQGPIDERSSPSQVITISI
jgi:hypothetical protein